MKLTLTNNDGSKRVFKIIDKAKIGYGLFIGEIDQMIECGFIKEIKDQPKEQDFPIVFESELEMLRRLSKKYIPVHILDSAYMEAELRIK